MIRELLTPDDFAGQPYYAGLNQIGHMAFGGALVMVSGVWLACLAVGFIELLQYYKYGATRKDCYQDTVFWVIGMIAIYHAMFPVIIVACGAAWMATVWYLSK